mmetsp:Transcript_4058/g.11358  ORF Transcript_4058/g.11358 Transcript_4058/m.11358 type:complete len:269 (-) Transcript_4058:765-1571(-)
MGRRVAVVTHGEVTVIGCDDRIRLTLRDVPSVPLTNAGSTGIRQNQSTGIRHFLEHFVTCNGGANLLGSRSDRELGTERLSVRLGLLQKTRRASHILVAAVRAAPNKPNLDIFRPIVFLYRGRKLGQGLGSVGRERSVHKWFELTQVNFDELVVLTVLVCVQKIRRFRRFVTNVTTAGGIQISLHAVVEGKEGRCGANLCAHIANGRHSRARNAVKPGTEILHNVARSSLDGENTCNLQDNILGGRPSVQSSLQVHADVLGGLQFPRK